MWGLAEISCETIHGFPNLRIFRAFRECRYAAPWLNNPVRVSTSEQITISRMLLVGLCKLELESKKPLLGAIFNSVYVFLRVLYEMENCRLRKFSTFSLSQWQVMYACYTMLNLHLKSSGDVPIPVGFTRNLAYFSLVS